MSLTANADSSPLAAPEHFQCFEIRNPPEMENESIRIALDENPLNALGSTRALPERTEAVDGDEGLSYLAVNIKKNWQPGRTLKIKFLSGELELHAKVRKYAEWWLAYANLKMSWLPMDAPKADIRIDFKQDGGSSSRIGTDALSETDQNKRTMNLDINVRHPDEYIRRKVLHEFGHVLGCEHEHQSPLASFEWNTDLIYQELSGPPNNWSATTIQWNVIKRLQSSEVSASAYDPDSIMLYAYPAKWFKNSGGVGTKNNTTLSKRDKEWITTNYPPWSSDIGQFSTLQLRSPGDVSSSPDTKDVAFEPPYAEPPRLAVGLSWLDLDCSSDISVEAKAEDVSDDHFTATIAAGPGSRVLSAACSWLEASATESEIKMGEWDAASAWASGGKPSSAKTSTNIKFNMPFEAGEAPVVIAWFSGLSLGKDSAWRVKTYVTEASRFKFKLHVETSPDTDLRGAKVTWVAFPTGKQGITGGAFCTDDVPGAENAGVVDFSGAGFQAAPAVMMAISGLDFEAGHNLRLRVSNSMLSKESMTWHLDTWLDSALNTATGAYVAICAPNVEDAY
ncbi:metalloprotease [Apodospora peruviana]|uniref:Metalloprotease n=1 Tax=Apodospora peruviana TaxID=516989 RepID=A0AAE0IK63_9PEZI|nr:metalloprotease [Apodospora peruviana]